MGEPDGPTVEGPPIPLGRPVSLAFGHLDGRFFATVDRRLVFSREFELPVRSTREPHLRQDGTRPPINCLHVGFAGPSGAAARILRLTAFHDVYYQPSEQRFELEQGQLFLLGDNTENSRDSRVRARDPYDMDDLVGRPIAILAPRARVRWL